MESLVRYLRQLQGGYVQVERGGPEACEGFLRAVQDDYLVLRSDEAVDLYLPLHHIRSITALPGADHPPAGETPSDEPPRFGELLSRQVGRRVRLYHAGPELTHGTVRACTEDYVLLEAPSGEVVCFTLFHIRSLYLLGDAPFAPLDTTEPHWGR